MSKAQWTDYAGRPIRCEFWLMSRRQCRHIASIQIPHPRDGAPYRYCERHARDYVAAHSDRLRVAAHV